MCPCKVCHHWTLWQICDLYLGIQTLSLDICHCSKYGSWQSVTLLPPLLPPTLYIRVTTFPLVLFSSYLSQYSTNKLLVKNQLETFNLIRARLFPHFDFITQRLSHPQGFNSLKDSPLPRPVLRRHNPYTLSKRQAASIETVEICHRLYWR